MTLNLALKNFISSACHQFGVLNCIKKYKQRNSAFVLTYHRLLNSPSDEPVFVQPGMYVSVDSFRRQVAFLKENFHVIPLAELVGQLSAGNCVNGCCAITFDDGWRDNFTHAFPILKDLQVPATIFLATSFIGTNRMFWPEEISYYLMQPAVWTAVEHRRTLARFLSEFGAPFMDKGFPDNVVVVLKTWSPQMREELLFELRLVSKAIPPDRLLIDWDEASEMQSSGLISFGAHTANHVILDQVTPQQAEAEILQSWHDLENCLGVRPEIFAYPNGNHTTDLQTILKRIGFRGAVTTRKGWIDKDVGLYEIPRISMHEDVSRTVPFFLARILLEKF